MLVEHLDLDREPGDRFDGPCARSPPVRAIPPEWRRDLDERGGGGRGGRRRERRGVDPLVEWTITVVARAFGDSDS